MSDIRPTASVSSSAALGVGVTIGAGVVVHSGVVLGDGCTIEPYCILGEASSDTRDPLVVGVRAHIRSRSVTYGGSTN